MKTGAACWLVNTGWTGGPFGIGKRISIRHTRALLDAALTGKLHDVAFEADPVFGFDVPTECPGVPSRILNPANTWSSRADYDHKYRALAARFIENFKLIGRRLPRRRREIRTEAGGSLSNMATTRELALGERQRP